jgi:hypothetical protein
MSGKLNRRLVLTEADLRPSSISRRWLRDAMARRRPCAFRSKHRML